MKVTVIPIVIGEHGTTNPNRTGRFIDRRTLGDHPDNSIIIIGQNTEKCPEDLRRLAVNRTPVTNHQLTLVCNEGPF